MTDTQMSRLEKLLSISGEPLALPDTLDIRSRDLAGTRADELEGLLLRRNGFYAFESALHVFATGATAPGSESSLQQWNAPELWRFEFPELEDAPVLFFAEDVFGVQFCLRQGQVHTFEPETGKFEYLADDLEGWAAAILADYKFLTGWPLANAWQALHGPLAQGQRLLPITGFAFGGAFAVENLRMGDAIEGMRYRGCIAQQMKGMAAGTVVKFTVS
ncbi:DUF2625 family protein [Pseudomonas sp. MWU13-3659]|uniref:DUF2625 family protein n=1 Tax=Pseudomonas sp. MWU13-3659 TaxID=2986964 RepID=UPI00207525C3|nr:DUF2625 family protein [Pseudomonas sp. MWU13-3659]